MKKIFFCLLFISGLAHAEQITRTLDGINEAQQLGMTAGIALACNAGGKLDDFELIASRIIANKALTPEAEKEGYEEYAVSKFNAYNMQRKNPQASCGEVLDSFSRLPIFKSVVYADGGVKMYDGSYLKPLRPVTKPSPKAKKK